MAKTLRFEGFSDDTFGEVVTGVDYDNCASGEPIALKVWSLSQANGLLVTGQYCPDHSTGWKIGVSRIDDDDDKHMPDWPMRFVRSDRPYSPALEIEAPDDVTVELLDVRADD